MKITKAVITAASRDQRTLPLQTLVDRDGRQKSVLQIIVQEARGAGIDDICVVVCPGDEAAYRDAIGDGAGQLHFVSQAEPLGYGHAVHCAREFTGGEPFLHMVGDHVYLSGIEKGCARQVVETAASHSCAVSGVQPTRENLLPFFGTIGGARVRGTKDLYAVERVAEKPTPTEAEQDLLVPGLRTGHYLCFFGIHVLTPLVMELLHHQVNESHHASQNHASQNQASQNQASQNDGGARMSTHAGATNVESNRARPSIALSPVLAELARHERYLALETRGRRYPVDARYGLFNAQLALALSGQDRDEVLSGLCELLAQREIGD